MQLYSPKMDGGGYFYHVNIYHEVLLTYAQELEREHRERPCTSDPDDSTDYGKLSWCKNGSMSFAEKDWNKLMIRLRDSFKRHAGSMLHANGQLDQKFIYYLGSTTYLKGKFLSRDRIYITHKSAIEFDEERFMNDLTRIGRWDK